jgi:hypothetical protein
VLSDRNGPYNRGLEISTLLLPAVAVATLTSKDMLPRPRKVRREAAQSRGKENKSVPISDKPVESSQTQKKEPKSHLYLLLVFPIVLLMMLHSLVTFLYIRALNPLYGNVPINLPLTRSSGQRLLLEPSDLFHLSGLHSLSKVVWLPQSQFPPIT